MNQYQLVKQQGGGYQNVYPLTYVQSIVDAESNEKLSDILVKYNHLYLNWQGSQENTRLSIPILIRKHGLWISYDMNGTLYTEWFKGSNITSLIDNVWKDSTNWERIPDLKFVEDASQRIPTGAILPEMLSPALQQLLAKQHNITNWVDDEDLESKCNVIKLKDKEYNPYTASGLGRKRLRKNWVKGRNLLTQEMINQPNTIYEIQYDYDLNGATIVIPEGCVLKFSGGSLDNGVIIGSSTIVYVDKNSVFGDTVKFSGYFNGDYLNVDSFEKIKSTNIPIGMCVNYVGDDFSVKYKSIDVNVSNKPYVDTATSRLEVIPDSDMYIIDGFGVKRNSIENIDSNARIIESLIKYSINMKFLYGVYYVRNIDISIHPKGSMAILRGNKHNDMYIDRIFTEINTDGADLFKISSNSICSLLFTNIKAKSKNRTGEFINYGSFSVDSGPRLHNCVFFGFNSVINKSGYATNIEVIDCLISTCRYGFIIGSAANLGKFRHLNFLDTAQCLNVYGQKLKITDIELQIKYTGDDWSTLDLYGIWAYAGVIERVYCEAYGYHESTSKFTIIIRSTDRYKSADLYLDNVTFATSGDTASANHMRIDSSTYLTGDGLAKRNTHFKTLYPRKVTYSEKKILPINLCIDGKPITDETCDYVSFNDTPYYIDNSKPIEIVSTQLAYTSFFRFEKEANIYNSKVPSDLFIADGNRYYGNTEQFFVLNRVGFFNVQIKIEATNISSDFDCMVMLRSRVKDGSYKESSLGVLRVSNGIAVFSYNGTHFHRGGTSLRFGIKGLGNTTSANIVELNNNCLITHSVNFLY